MFSHVMVGASDLARARTFYDAALGALGIRPGREAQKRLFWVAGGSTFMVTQPLDGREASGANGGTIGFAAASSEAVDAFHAAAVAEGGTSIEEPPGWRDNPFGRLYLAYVRDPEGNKICALHRPAQ